MSEIRSSDAERQSILAHLQVACVEGRLTLDEYGQRVERALASRTRAELDALVADLPTPPSTRTGSARPDARQPRGSVATTLAVFGSAQRRGFWRVADQTRVVAIFGACTLDLRSARISAPRTDIDVIASFGSIDIVVPPGVEVDLDAHVIFGARDMRLASRAPESGAPVIRIRGVVIFGSLRVSDGTTPETHIDAYG